MTTRPTEDDLTDEELEDLLDSDLELDDWLDNQDTEDDGLDADLNDL